MTVMGNMRQFFRVTPKDGRRGFLKRMAAAPLAGRMAADEAAKALAGIGGIGVGGYGPPMTTARDNLREISAEACATTTGNPANPLNWRILRQMKDEAIKTALQSPTMRAKLEQTLYRMHRNVHSLDVDLAANRSMSLAAKITFQRQRNVQHEIDWSIEDRTTHREMLDWKRNILSVAGIDL